MPNTLKKIDKAKDSAQGYQKEYTFDRVATDPRFQNQTNQKAEYSPWGWKYNELANLQVEISRIALIVRLNSSESPNYLKVYHAHLYSLLLPLSVVLADQMWKRIDKLWHDVATDINTYEIKRRTIPNSKIDPKLIEKLDSLYRITLLMMQQSNLGIPTSQEIDLNKAIEDSIVGS